VILPSYTSNKNNREIKKKIKERKKRDDVDRADVQTTPRISAVCGRCGCSRRPVPRPTRRTARRDPFSTTTWSGWRSTARVTARVTVVTANRRADREVSWWRCPPICGPTASHSPVAQTSRPEPAETRDLRRPRHGRHHHRPGTPCVRPVASRPNGGWGRCGTGWPRVRR
jgi:hypothetical protein